MTRDELEEDAVFAQHAKAERTPGTREHVDAAIARCRRALIEAEAVAHVDVGLEIVKLDRLRRCAAHLARAAQSREAWLSGRRR